MKFLILLILVVAPSFLVGCRKPKIDNLDLSNLRIPKRVKNNISSSEISSSITEKKEIVRNKLKSYPKVSQIINSAKFGKADPFSAIEIQTNKLRSDFHLKGFLNTLTSKYAFVSYIDNEGTLSEDSIGGINTNLLPKGAKVVNIDPDNMKLIIKFENENFIFEL